MDDTQLKTLAPILLTQDLSANMKKEVENVYEDRDQTKAELVSQLDIIFNDTSVSSADKAVYAKYIKESNAKEAQIVAKIEAGINATDLTPSQKALYAKIKAIFQNQDISGKKSEEQIEVAKKSASDEDRIAVETAIIAALTKE
uniref:Phage protein n=1 Tax=Rhabditophanes sp. KR3021 TaxID=114890 RepID=A0AC35TNV4_9BILA